VLSWHLAKWGFALSDNKWPTPTMVQMGFRTIPRAEFLRRLEACAAADGKVGRWEVEVGPEIVATWQSGQAVKSVTDGNA
jgi:leucyl/phenylalanyl-tRNA--protein transferase